jgi:hypothetical protein
LKFKLKFEFIFNFPRWIQSIKINRIVPKHDAVRYQIWVALDIVQRVIRKENLFLACVFDSKTMTKTTLKDCILKQINVFNFSKNDGKATARKGKTTH